MILIQDLPIGVVGAVALVQPGFHPPRRCYKGQSLRSLLVQWRVNILMGGVEARVKLKVIVDRFEVLLITSCHLSPKKKYFQKIRPLKRFDSFD